MAAPTVLDVFTVPVYRKGPSVLGLAMIALLFLVPGLLAPIGLLQVVAALWLFAALITAVRDVRHVQGSSAA